MLTTPHHQPKFNVQTILLTNRTVHLVETNRVVVVPKNNVGDVLGLFNQQAAYINRTVPLALVPMVNFFGNKSCANLWAKFRGAASARAP